MTWHSLDRSPYGQFSLKTGLLSAALFCVECRRRGRVARENIRYECGCILPAPDAARSTDRRAGIRSRQDIRMDVSPFAGQGLPPLVFPVERHGKKDKDLSGADSLLEPRFPLLFASWSDAERMIVMKIFFYFQEEQCRSLCMRWWEAIWWQRTTLSCF